MINIDELLSKATKEKSPALSVYRLIKAEFLRWVKDNPGKNFDGTVEAKILKKMYDQRKESYNIYNEAGRNDLAEIEAFEAGILKALLPEETSPEKIIMYTTKICDELIDNGTSITMKDMKSILAKVQETYPDANGKIVSNVVKRYC